MPPTAPTRTPEPSRPPGYDLETGRLKELRELVEQFAPRAFCEEEGKATIIDPMRGEHQDADLVSARNLALIDAWKAIGVLARNTVAESRR